MKLILVIFAMLLLMGAVSITNHIGRYQISGAEKLYCWVLDTATGEIKLVNFRDGKLNTLVSIE